MGVMCLIQPPGLLLPWLSDLLNAFVVALLRICVKKTGVERSQKKYYEDDESDGGSIAFEAGFRAV